MTGLGMLRARMRPLALALGSLWAVQSCYSWRLQPRPVSQVIADERPVELRLTLHDGRRLEVRGLRIVGDTLTGVTSDGREQVSVALSAVRAVEVARLDGVKTAVATVGIGIGIAAILAIFVMVSGEGCMPFGCGWSNH